MAEEAFDLKSAPAAKPGNDLERRIYVGWVKMQVQFEAVCGPKFLSFNLELCKRPLLVANTYARLSISCFVPKI